MRQLRGSKIPWDQVFSRSAIEEAHQRIQPHIHQTPLMTSRWLNQKYGRQFFFKCENLQRGGAFKIRGATNAVLKLGDEEASRGVVTHSSGNHAQALAIAAAIRGIPCTVVMPSNAPAVKRQATQGYGARVIACEPNLQARESTTQTVIQETGATLIHPYDHDDVIQGQATCVKEMLEQNPELDGVSAPVGGGGLMAGTCLSANLFSSRLRVLAAEPEGANDAFRGFQSGQRIESHQPNTIADGLLTTVGPRNWEIIYRLADSVVTVSDQQILAAMQFFWERMKLVVEPSGAVSLAAVLGQLEQKQWPDNIQQIGIVISGGNRLFVA